MLDVLLKFSQNRPKKILFTSRLKKGHEKAKRPNHFISRKMFLKRPNGNPAMHRLGHRHIFSECDPGSAFVRVCLCVCACVRVCVRVRVCYIFIILCG